MLKNFFFQTVRASLSRPDNKFDNNYNHIYLANSKIIPYFASVIVYNMELTG